MRRCNESIVTGTDGLGHLTHSDVRRIRMKGPKKGTYRDENSKAGFIEVVGGNNYRMKVMVRDMEHRMSTI